MTPKEKAKDLFKKFEDESLHFEDTIIDTAKFNSLLCVDEVIKATQRETINDSGTGIDIIPMKYWLDVKNEISLL